MKLSQWISLPPKRPISPLVSQRVNPPLSEGQIDALAEQLRKDEENEDNSGIDLRFVLRIFYIHSLPSISDLSQNQ